MEKERTSFVGDLQRKSWDIFAHDTTALANKAEGRVQVGSHRRDIRRAVSFAGIQSFFLDVSSLGRNLKKAEIRRKQRKTESHSRHCEEAWGWEEWRGSRELELDILSCYIFSSSSDD